VPPGTYLVRVFGAAGAKNSSYSLSIDPPDPPPGSTTFDIDLTSSGLSPSQQAIFQQAIEKWESIIVGELPNITLTDSSNNSIEVDDLLIDARAVAIDNPGNLLGRSTSDAFRAGSLLPAHGTIELDTADLATLEASGNLLAVMVHEIGHVLGFGTLWASKRLIVGAGGTNPRFTGPNAVAAYRSIFGTRATAVPVENTGGAGTRDSHWRESAFANELMTPALGTATSFPLSRITVAAMADLGYTVNLDAADPYTRPSLSLLAVAGASAIPQRASSAAPGSSAGVIAPPSLLGIRQAAAPRDNSFPAASLPATAGRQPTPRASPLAVDQLLAEVAWLWLELESNDRAGAQRRSR
jgi:hypothetical protein